MFHRSDLIKQSQAVSIWDIIIIGGGATGLGIAVDAASRGFTALLLEAADFATATSSRSTKLVHGGVRYLEQGNIELVYSSLKERGLLLQNAPHIVHKQSFIIPCYSFWEKIKFGVGLRFYDWLSTRFSFGSSRYIKKQDVLRLLPGIKGDTLKGGVEYFDGQFDDARLAINLAQTAIHKGAVTLNYFRVTGLLKNKAGKIAGVAACDQETGITYQFEGRVVANATGVYTDGILKMDAPHAQQLITASQGTHIVISKTFLNTNSALMIPSTIDGRVLFAVPWHDRLLVGTTDTPVNTVAGAPVPQMQEIEFILATLKQYISPAPGLKDILSVFSGLRPLVKQNKLKSTKDLSRDHKIFTSSSGLLTITGGKWTTYRKMAEDLVNSAIKMAGLKKVSCQTAHLKIHGWLETGTHANVYGTDQAGIQQLTSDTPAWNEKLVDNFPNTAAEVIWAVRNEMARTIEDVLARRLRILFLDVEAALKAAPRVAQLMASELGFDDQWKEEQLTSFYKLAENYRASAAC